MTEDEITEIKNNHASIPASNETVIINHKKIKLKFEPSKINFGMLFGNPDNE
jgi:hypothetical protein